MKLLKQRCGFGSMNDSVKHAIRFCFTHPFVFLSVGCALLSTTSFGFASEDLYYIGNRKCRLCHFEYFKEWAKDPHANAFARLGRMQNNPYCLKCHTTGYGEPQGFVSEKITPELRGVQCEACHGPGSRHKDNPHDKNALPIGRKIDYPTVCIKCHDRNWTPEFDYEKYRTRIEHRKPSQE